MALLLAVVVEQVEVGQEDFNLPLLRKRAIMYNYKNKIMGVVLMKALVILGSPRINENTDILLNEVIKGLESQKVEVEKINLGQLEYGHCIGCDICGETGHCYKEDDMTPLYDKFDEADIIVVGSPMYFNTVTSITKTMIDRCQAFWSSKYILKKSSIDQNKRRRGMYVGVGGAKHPDLEKGFIGATVVMDLFFRAVNTDYLYNILVDNTDEVSVRDKEDILRQAYELGVKLGEA